jgi:hypothetical protein
MTRQHFTTRLALLVNGANTSDYLFACKKCDVLLLCDRETCITLAAQHVGHRSLVGWFQ